MGTLFINWGSAETQATRNAMIEGSFGDKDGWVRWSEHPPARDLLIQLRVGDDIGFFETVPSQLPATWDMTKAWWRTPR